MASEGIKVSFKVWLEYGGEPLIGLGGARLLRLVDDTGSISKAAEIMGVSYKFAWSYIKSVEKKLGVKIVETHRGGRGGGYAKLTEDGRKLILFYEKLFKEFRDLALIFEEEGRGLLKNTISSSEER